MPFTIYEDQFYSGMYEVEMQNSELFNEASNGTMRIIPREHIGDFSKEAFFTEESNLITRRDTTADTDGSSTSSDSDEVIGVKLARRFQHEDKLTEIKKIGFTEQEYSFMVGQQIAKAKQKEMLNTAILALVTCLDLSSDNYVDITADSPNTLNYDSIPTLMQKFGDNANALQHIIGHSKPVHDWLGDSFDTETTNVAGFAMNTGGFPTLGKSLGVTDSPNFVEADGVSSGVDSYKTIWLAENAVRVEESEEETVVGRLVDGKENLVVRTQGEFSYTLKIKGYKYSSSSANPNDSALGTAGNWGQVATDTKSTAGVFIETA